MPEMIDFKFGKLRLTCSQRRLDGDWELSRPLKRLPFEQDVAKALLALHDSQKELAEILRVTAYVAGAQPSEEGDTLAVRRVKQLAAWVNTQYEDIRRLEAQLVGARKALQQIAAPPECGCYPRCLCDSEDALRIRIEEMRDIAVEALAQPAQEVERE